MPRHSWSEFEGVKQELAADMMVHVSIDGKETVPVALASGQRNDEDQWTLSGMSAAVLRPQAGNPGTVPRLGEPARRG